MYEGDTGIRFYDTSGIEFQVTHLQSINKIFKKDKIDLSNVTSMSFIENKLIDHMKYITIIEFVLRDDSKVYFDLLFYSRRNRDMILDTLYKSLTQDDK